MDVFYSDISVIDSTKLLHQAALDILLFESLQLLRYFIIWIFRFDTLLIKQC